MATFMEAMQAAREGKRVRTSNSHWCVFDKNGWFVTSPTSNEGIYLVSTMLDDDWEIEQPRKYTFLEAVEMMENGKGMRSLISGTIYYLNKFEFRLLSKNGMIIAISYHEIKNKWIEVVP